jgi:hypothetical protein
MAFIGLMGALVILRHRLRGSSPARQAMHAFVRRVGGTEARNTPSPFSNRHPLVDDPRHERHYLVRVDDIVIEIFPWIGEGQKTNLELRADVAVPPCPSFKVTKGGAEKPPDELADAWREVTSRVGWLIVRCDGDAVTAQLGYPFDVDGVAAVADLVARIARLDEGLTETLLALPGASALEGHALVPGVVLSADGLVIGVRSRQHMVAQLDDVTHVGQLPAPTQELVARAGDGDLLVTEQGARFTWKGIERDPAKLRAGVDALRSLRGAQGPYR